MNRLDKLNYSRIFTLSKVLLFLFLFLYSAPIFFYSDNLVFEKYYFLTIYILLALYLFFEKINTNRPYKSIQIAESKFYFLIVILGLIYLVVFYVTKDNYIQPFNRSTRDASFLQGNTYVILDIIVKTIFCVLIYSEFLFQKNNSFRRFILVVLVILAMIFDIVYLGARRTSIFIIMALIWAIIPYLKSRKYISLLFILLVIGWINFLLSGFRELVYIGSSDLSFEKVMASSLLSNEYQLVSDNFLKYKDYANTFGFGYGISIFSFPLLFVPRFIWSSKPLTIDKSTEIFPNLLGELYYNFGIFSILFLLIYIFFLMYIIKKKNILSMVVFSLIPEFFRTPVSIFLFTLIIYLILINIFLIRIKKH